MQKFLEATGENRDAAVENALKQLGLERDDVSVEVLEIGKKGFLGIGATPARVRVTYEAPDIPAAKPEVKREERKCRLLRADFVRRGRTKSTLAAREVFSLTHMSREKMIAMLCRLRAANSARFF